MKKFIMMTLNFFVVRCGFLFLGLTTASAQKAPTRTKAPTHQTPQKKVGGQKKLLPTKPRTPKKKTKKKTQKPPQPKRKAVKTQPIPVVDKNVILDKEIALFNNVVKSALLSDQQKIYIVNTIIPVLMAERGLTPASA